MKSMKKILCAALCLAIILALGACAKKGGTQIANPMKESSVQELEAAGVVMPEIGGKTPTSCSTTDLGGGKVLYQADYGSFTVRAQKTDRQEDISGMNYKWQSENLSTPQLLQGDPIVKTDGEGAGIVYWYLGGMSWSAGMTQGADADTLLSIYFAVADANP